MITAEKANQLWDKENVSTTTQDLRRVDALVRLAIVVKQDKWVDVFIHPETIPKLEELGYKVVEARGKLYRVSF